jgi:hypothetical protein
MQRLRKRIHVSPATAIATLALVFAMSGGAYAAKHYLITSTKQISPKVLKSLKGANGKTGAPGLAGPAGPGGAKGANGTNGANGEKGAAGTNGGVGPVGPTGPTGPTGATGLQGATGEINTAGPLPSGKTETGAWSTTPYIATAGEIAVDSISFAIPLAAPLENVSECGEPGKPPCQVHFIKNGGPSTTECPGTAEAPAAKSGNLCLYAAIEANGRTEYTIASTGNGSFASGAGTTGAMIFVKAANAGPAEFWGTWAVTG